MTEVESPIPILSCLRNELLDLTRWGKNRQIETTTIVSTNRKLWEDMPLLCWNLTVIHVVKALLSEPCSRPWCCRCCIKHICSTGRAWPQSHRGVPLAEDCGWSSEKQHSEYSFPTSWDALSWGSYKAGCLSLKGQLPLFYLQHPVLPGLGQ